MWRASSVDHAGRGGSGTFGQPRSRDVGRWSVDVTETRARARFLRLPPPRAGREPRSRRGVELARRGKYRLEASFRGHAPVALCGIFSGTRSGTTKSATSLIRLPREDALSASWFLYASDPGWPWLTLPSPEVSGVVRSGESPGRSPVRRLTPPPPRRRRPWRRARAPRAARRSRRAGCACVDERVRPALTGGTHENRRCLCARAKRRREFAGNHGAEKRKAISLPSQLHLFVGPSVSYAKQSGAVA
jgi:hypothetical protein